MSEPIDPFHVQVDESVLEDLRHRLERTRFPDQIDGTGWEYGIPIDYLRELVDYWLDSYDWRAQEARLNSFSQFTTRIDGQTIHFIHARSAHADAVPLLLTHGWPGSIVEFLDVIPRLTDPEVLRREPGGRVPCGRTLAAGLRVLRTPAHAGLGRAPHLPGVHHADEQTRLHEVRRAGRRLGRAGDDQDRRARRRALHGHPSQHGPRCDLRTPRLLSATRSRPTWRRPGAS